MCFLGYFRARHEFLCGKVDGSYDDNIHGNRQSAYNRLKIINFTARLKNRIIRIGHEVTLLVIFHSARDIRREYTYVPRLRVCVGL